jgi:16S rRNA processing protein RimM
LRTELDFDIEELRALFVEEAGGRAPYFVSEIRESGPGYVVTLEEVDQVEKARTLVGKKVFIATDLIMEHQPETDWIGYELADKTHGSLGKITGVSDNGQQVLVTLVYKGKEVILPLVEEFIESVDEAGKRILFDAPDGLIDLYLELPE